MIERDWSILDITVKTKMSTNRIDLYEDLKITPETLNQDFCDQPAKYAYWATVAAQAKALVDRKKLEIEKQDDYLKKTLTGELDSVVREQLEMNGEKVTETKVTSGINTHELYKAEREKLNSLKDELLELQENATILDIATQSMNQRKDALISLGAQLRTEGNNTELSIKTASANETISKNRSKRQA